MEKVEELKSTVQDTTFLIREFKTQDFGLFELQKFHEIYS